jgi:hypothetical protein
LTYIVFFSLIFCNWNAFDPFFLSRCLFLLHPFNYSLNLCGHFANRCWFWLMIYFALFSFRILWVAIEFCWVGRLFIALCFYQIGWNELRIVFNIVMPINVILWAS